MFIRFIEKSLPRYSIFSRKQLSDSNRFIQGSKVLSKSNPTVTDTTLMDSSLPIGRDEEIRSKAYKICSDHLGGVWSKITPHDMSLIPISGGMSNILYCCSLPESLQVPNDVPAQVLLRFYGESMSDSDVTIQLKIFSLLSLKDLGPKLYGQFEEGRLEEFLPAVSMTCDEVTDVNISSIIAKKLAAIHSLDVPIDRKNHWLSDRLIEWIEYINKYRQDYSFNQEVQSSTQDIAHELLAIDLDKEMQLMHQLFKQTQSPYVFSHNDLHQGNILLAKNSKRRTDLEDRIVIIDFEYSSYNYRAYDIANHFIEWCFEYDTPEYPHFKLDEQKFPPIDKQLNFVSAYLKQNRSVQNSSNAKGEGEMIDEMNNHCDNKVIGNGYTNGHTKTNIHEMELNDLMKEIEPFFMVSNLLWTVWCIKTARTSSIKFGYWEHALARWKLYLDFKTTYFNQSVKPLT